MTTAEYRAKWYGEESAADNTTRVGVGGENNG